MIVVSWLARSVASVAVLPAVSAGVLTGVWPAVVVVVVGSVSGGGLLARWSAVLGSVAVLLWGMVIYLSGSKGFIDRAPAAGDNSAGGFARFTGRVCL